MVVICSITLTGLKSQTTIEPFVKVPESTLRKTIKNLELCEVVKEKNGLLETQVALLKKQIAIKDSIYKAYVIKDTAQAHIAATYKAEIDNMQQQLKLCTAQANKQNKYYRRQKKKTVFVAIAGPVVTAATILYLKK